MKFYDDHMTSSSKSSLRRWSSSIILWAICISFLSAPILISARTQIGSHHNKAVQHGSPKNYDVLPNSASQYVGVVNSTGGSAVQLNESQIVTTILPINSTSPAQFYLPAPFKNASQPLYIAASLCSGPAIPSYDVDNSTLLDELGMDYWEAMQATVPIMYVSTLSSNQIPGPKSKIGDPDIAYFLGGLAEDVNYDKQPEGAWITIYPPTDTRNITIGEWSLVVVASTETQPLKLQQTQGLQFADSDRENALLMTFNYSQGVSPNLTLAILPTEGPEALPDSYYYNSSICAISTAFFGFNSPNNNNRPQVNRSETMRGSLYENTTRVQWSVSNLRPATNYTAWLVEIGQSGTTLSGTSTLWPAIKFVTKRSENCRLVYDVDFCPAVAYSIPVSPSVSTETALNIINETFTPNFVNFSATLDTFPCGNKDFGQYSPLQTCDMCMESYRDWLCAVTMPRCTDPLTVVDNETSAAYPNPNDLMGINTPQNTNLLPYVLNRDDNSRQPYIDSAGGLNAGSYGEILPCIYLCYEVASSCPQPLIQWYCPIWDITAQSQYGAFADSDDKGVGEGENGGAGQFGQRYGGPTKFVSQDGFGNVFCNSLGVQRRLIQSWQPSKGMTSKQIPSSITLVILVLFFTTILI